MPLGTAYPGQDCALARALEIIGERWTMLIVRDAFYGTCRFGDFAEHLEIPRAVLSARLAGLVGAGVLDRVGPDHSPEYHLTDAGVALWPVLWSMLQWGSAYASRRLPSVTFTHAECGERLLGTGACSACALTPSPTDIDVVADRKRGRARPDAVSGALRHKRRLLTPIR